MSISFEEAKKKWLSEIGNKSWEELHDEREASLDEKAQKLMTPEYLAMWKAGEKELNSEEE